VFNYYLLFILHYKSVKVHKSFTIDNTWTNIIHILHNSIIHDTHNILQYKLLTSTSKTKIIKQQLNNCFRVNHKYLNV